MKPRLLRIEHIALCLVTACFCPPESPILCDFPTFCVDPCCDAVTETCGEPCPRGTVDRRVCVPDVRCPAPDAGGLDAASFDTGTDTGSDAGTICAPTDPGPICYVDDDPCCEHEPMFPTITADCRYRCPEGTSFESAGCIPDPSCEPETECDQPSECTTTAVECCAPCREHELEDVTGIRIDAESSYRDALCEDVGACPPCAPPPAPYLVATCNARSCTALDTRQLLLSRCSVDEDCRMRATDCCECGADTSAEALIAIRIDGEADYLNLVCDDDAICDDCVPTYPSTHEAFCDEGRCGVRSIGDGT